MLFPARKRLEQRRYFSNPGVLAADLYSPGVMPVSCLKRRMKRGIAVPFGVMFWRGRLLLVGSSLAILRWWGLGQRRSVGGIGGPGWLYGQCYFSNPGAWAEDLYSPGVMPVSCLKRRMNAHVR